ncbi:MAG: CDP-alcohol phosphatidyltransferase family protein [Eggerthellaceae bacterium]
MEEQHTENDQEEVLDKIFTIPNLISFIRLCLVPVFFYLLLQENNLAAAIVFAVSAGTDFIDGQVARRTHTVSRLGQLLDPAVDRILMIFGVIGLFMVGRLPLWIILVVLIRDLFLLAGGYYLLKRYQIRVPVIYPGKVATTFLFIGFAGLVLNMPLIAGLGICDIWWLPGFNMLPVSWGIWFVYAGLLLAVATTTYYIYAGVKKMNEARRNLKD